ncbi:MAG TPA: FAD-dependent oxidoreductase [Ktedonobacteraceae bacterium]|jgi:NADPH-dependent 2,4-dienoyl-CoA reductase/sulfur reductase-like enzyme/pSer/pThr/pTyr-binding forkhead associated (FHA) protein/CRP-like cAMP-binding protein
MHKQHAYVIIGNGITGVTAAEILREHDPAGSITMIADDPFPAYYRPALKDFLGGRLPEEKLWARPATFYKERHLRFLPARVMSLDPRQQTLQLHNGAVVRYDSLLLANGARPRTLECPGLNLAGVSTLRSVADYQEILHRLEHVRRVVVCGSGTLALESAETLRHRGYAVTHLLRGKLFWSEVLDPVASDMVLQEERRDGIEVRCGEEIAKVLGTGGQVSGVLTTRGEHIPCELVLIAIGIEPLTDFIRAGGIACGRGVQVDETMGTSVPGIYAAGDVIETVDRLGGRIRVQGQWFPAIQQAQIAAYNMLAAAGRTSARVSSATFGQLYNATFLYGLDFVAIGLTTSPATPDFQELVEAPQARSYRKVILYHGQAVGTLLLGNRRQALALKRAIDHQVNLTQVAHRLFAEDFDLDTWLTAQGAPEPLLTPPNAAPAGAATALEPGAGTRTLAAMRSQALSQDAEAYLVPIPHPRVPVLTTELLIPRATMTIGRQTGVSWLLDHGSVSRMHAEVAWIEGAYTLRDIGSSNGTFVNGSPLARGTTYQLSPQDEVRFGDVRFRFEVRPPSAPGQHAPATMSAPFAHLHGTELHSSASRLIPEAIVASLPRTPALVLVGADGLARTQALTHGQRYLLGRDQQNDLVLPDASTSRRHAEIFSTPDGFSIRDLNSRYGVFVNQGKITNSYHLSHGDRIVLGNVLVYFSHPQTHQQVSATETALITRQSVALTVENTRTTHTPEKPSPVVVGMEHRADIEPLSQQRIKFEIDMCIGCNRCMEACPVPMSSQVTIATLNTATVTKDITPTVARFTHECVMCGSCVPVCPVDNHRDLLMLALKQRLGVAWKNQPDMSRVIQVLPAGWPLPLLLQRLREQSVFRDSRAIPETYLLHIIAASTRKILGPGEELVREGEYGRDLFVILEGKLELTTTDRERTELVLAILQRGEYIGEDGLLTGQPYKATVRAQTPTLLLQIPEQVAQSLMELVPQVRQHFEGFTRARSLYTLLTHMDLFEGVTPADLQELARAAQIRPYDRGERLFAEDSKGRPPRETVHILLEGFVKVARRLPARGESGGERIIAYRQGGDYFAGGLDLLGDGQAVTVTTINRCRVARLPRQAVLALFQRYPALEQRFALRLREYLEAATATRDDMQARRALSGRAAQASLPEIAPADPRVQTGLHDLVSHGVVEGTEVLIIDLDKCIHCNECEYACERRHGHSRMNRKGQVIGNISITTTCRQCQDPVCMLCSRAGIARHPNGEVYITESCIGCGICAERCPYGAISIVSTDQEAVGSTPWQRLSEWFVRGSGQGPAAKLLPMNGQSTTAGNHSASEHHTVRGGYDELRKKIAIKCDLCAGYRDQACVQACPAGAAMRIRPTSFFGSTEEILQRQVK